MSSEEDGEGGDGHCLITVPLPWESSKLRRYKDQLDKVYLENSTRHAIAQQKQWKEKKLPCLAGLCLTWHQRGWLTFLGRMYIVYLKIDDFSVSCNPESLSEGIQP